VKFRATDGFVFRKEGDVWTDGDLVYPNAPDRDWPLDCWGQPLEGAIINEEGPPCSSTS
jgi:hypothetical protein